MFDIGWPELLVIATVLIVVVGPKDLPGMLRTFGRTMSKLRGMAAEFRTQFDDALREAELDEVRKAVDDVRSFDPRKAAKDAVDPLRKAGEDMKRTLDGTVDEPMEGAAAAGVDVAFDSPIDEDFAMEPLKGASTDHVATTDRAPSTPADVPDKATSEAEGSTT